MSTATAPARRLPRSATGACTGRLGTVPAFAGLSLGVAAAAALVGVPPPLLLFVLALGPTVLGLAFANRLLIDAARHRFVVVQPECPGDAIATDRVLELEFATPIKASDVETLLQDGLDT